VKTNSTWQKKNKTVMKSIRKLGRLLGVGAAAAERYNLMDEP
jgi:hypothetical protein